jgi:predicted ArsR family transcriptional regulator
MARDGKRRTRDKVLLHLKQKGPQSASELAKRIRVTPVAVRQHLYALSESGLVAFDDERCRVGRPRRIWRLAPLAQAAFPDGHSDLAIELIDAMERAFGDEGLDRLVATRTRAQLKRYREILPPPDAPLQKRVAALAKLRRAEGFMAEWSKERDGTLLLVENHCPICAAAAVCPSLCRDELSIFKTAIGKGIPVERVEYILAGGRRCAYRIGRPPAS